MNRRRVNAFLLRMWITCAWFEVGSALGALFLAATTNRPHALAWAGLDIACALVAVLAADRIRAQQGQP